MKKIVSTLMLGSIVLGLSACAGGKAVEATCHSDDYTRAGPAQRAAKGWFYTCGGKNCIVHTETKVNGKVQKTNSRLRKPGEFFISRRVDSWSAKGCGTIYRKRAK